MEMKFFSNLKQKKKLLKEKKTGIRIITQFDTVVDEYMKKNKDSSAKNWLVIRYVKKDSEVMYKVGQLINSSVIANGAHYLIDARAIQFVKVVLIDTKQNNKIAYKIPIVDIYEGRTEAVSHEKWANQVNLSEEFQKQMYLELSNGILEARRKSKANLRQILIYGMIAVVAFVLIGSIFFK